MAITDRDRELIFALTTDYRDRLGAAACSVALVVGDELEFVAASGAGAAEIVGVRIPTDRGIAGWVAMSGQGIAVADVHRDERWDAQTAQATGYLPTSILAVPIEGDDETLGVVEVLDRTPGSYDLELASAAARQVALILHHARAREQADAQPMPAWSEAFSPDRLGPVRPLQEWTRSQAWGVGRGGGVRVAVIDSGVDGDHPWVGGVSAGVVVEPDPNSPSGVRYVEGPHEDLYGHGTACAGIIRRLAPDCEIVSIRVLGSTLKGQSGIFAAGLQWAIEHGIQVINLSLSTRSTLNLELFHQLVDRAAFANVMLVSAVNNVRAPSYPSLMSGVFSVAAYAGRKPEHFVVNPKPPVEYGAPGLDLEVAWTGSSTIRATGNSCAAPHLAGLAARIVGHHPQVTVAEVKSILRAVADNARR